MSCQVEQGLDHVADLAGDEGFSLEVPAPLDYAICSRLFDRRCFLTLMALLPLVGEFFRPQGSASVSLRHAMFSRRL